MWQASSSFKIENACMMVTNPSIGLRAVPGMDQVLSTYLLSQILKPKEAINVVSIISHNHKKGQFSRLTSYTISNHFKKDTDRCQNCQMVQTLHLNSKEVRKTYWRLEWEPFLQLENMININSSITTLRICRVAWDKLEVLFHQPDCEWGVKTNVTSIL